MIQVYIARKQRKQMNNHWKKVNDRKRVERQRKAAEAREELMSSSIEEWIQKNFKQEDTTGQ